MIIRAILICFTLSFVLAGCRQQEASFPDKAPLPVTVLELKKIIPETSRTVSGSVRPWKSEDIGFEVDGRIKWVVEPGIEVIGRSYHADGKILSPGTQIAQLDDERFSIALQSAASKVEIEELKRDGVQIQISKSFPAELASAKAQRDLASTEYERNKRLVKQNAGSQKNLDKAKASLDAAESKQDGILARLEQAKSELKSADAAIEQAKQELRDKTRDLADTKLFSAFGGQIADTYVVPGSGVKKNEMVAAIQMMNPIKVELEVSAEMSRRIRPQDTISVSLTTTDNHQEKVEAVVFTVAPSADNATRTFTVTLLIRNRRVHAQIPKSPNGQSVARTYSLWRVNLGVLPETPADVWYMPQTGLHKDKKGSYVWRVTNLKSGEQIRRLLKVEKLYVKPGDVSVPFLGKARFLTVEIISNQNFTPETDLFLSNLKVDGVEVDNWNGDQVLLEDRGRWLLRPGDIVDVDLSPKNQKLGFYVPVSAIYEESGKTSIFLIENAESNPTARKVAVKVLSAGSIQAGSLQQIETISEDDELENAQIIVEGVYYVADGESVMVVSKNRVER